MLHKSSLNVMSQPSILPDKRRPPKSLVLDSDDDFDAASPATGFHVPETVTISGSLGLPSDNEDTLPGFETHNNHDLTSTTSTDKCHAADVKLITPDEADDIRAPPVPSPPESDVEEDVKVCDICGDAGREDLLAVCSKCSDGAEHTYCMREMLDKVPEGDWLCEECKCNELLEAHKLDHLKKLGSHERSKFLGRTNSLLTDISLKEGKDPIWERAKPRNFSLNRQASSKRSGEKLESCHTAKKQALESNMGSPTTSSPSQMAELPKDAPFKITGPDLTGDSSENACYSTTVPPHSVKSTIMKSNSFSSATAKQNMKVSEDVHQKQSVDAKDGIGKLIGKSTSFKGLGRPCSIEPKVKMLPAKCAPAQDLKGQKHGKDRTSYDKKNNMKPDHSLPGPVAANPAKRSSDGSDDISTLFATNTRDFKGVQTDGKLSKHAGHLSHKTSDTMTNIGEVKKQSYGGIAVSSSINVTSNALETKPSHYSVKDGLVTRSSRTADGSLNTDGARADGQDSQGEKAPEKISGHSRQGLNSGVVSGSRRRLPLDASASKVKDGLHEENKLKAAIEAAMQKKLDIFKKNKIPEKRSELTSPVGDHGGDVDSNQVRDSLSVEEIHVGDMDSYDINLNSNGAEQTDSEKSFVGESILTVSSIPEQESVWQGGFEIHRNGKLPDMCGGFQAHMSMFASGKVLEMVGKFRKKIIFNEVPRSSAWPVPFKDPGVRENNIALYFFAKDSESYMRSYKILVDYMMKHDLALRGNIDGVELLVFPSNHLPQKSKCWNTFYFIWGIFRGRRPRFLDDKICTLRKCESSDISTTENPCLYKPGAEQLSVSGDDHNFVSGCEAPVVVRPSLHQCASSSNGDCFKEECSVGQRCLDSPGNHKLPKNHYTSLREACPESGTATLREQCQQNPKDNQKSDHQISTVEINSGKNLPSEVMLDKEDNFLPSKLPQVCNKGDYIKTVKPENNVKQDRRCLANMLKSGEMKFENDIDKKESTNYLLKNGIAEGNLRSEDYVDINVSTNRNVDDLHRPQYSPKRHFHEDSVEDNSLADVSVTIKKRPWVDRIDVSEDQASYSKSVKGFGNFSGGCSMYGRPLFGDRVEVQMSGVSSSSHKEGVSDDTDNGNLTAPNARQAEGCLFVVESHHAHGIQPTEVALSDNEDRLPGESPNLELALGVKRKQAREGGLHRYDGGLDRKDPDWTSGLVASSKEEQGDSSASLSLSLGFPFLDKGRVDSPEGPSATVDQTVSASHEIHTSLLLFRGSSSK